MFKLRPPVCLISIYDTHVTNLLSPPPHSRNTLSSLSEGVFLNCSVRRLDLSHNRLGYVASGTSLPLAPSLIELDVSHNGGMGAEALAALVRPLHALEQLGASDLHLVRIEPDSLLLLSRLRAVSFAGNALSSMPLPLPDALQEIDLSRNRLSLLRAEELEGLANLTAIRRVGLRGNPIDCSGCAVTPLFRALNESFFSNCSFSEGDCPECRLPEEMSGRLVSSLLTEELYCHVGSYDRHHLANTSRVGLIVAIAIIAVIVAVLAAIIAAYRRHVAHYYTREEEQRAWKGAAVGGAYADDGQSTFVATPDKVDENIDDLRRPPIASIVR